MPKSFLVKKKRQAELERKPSGSAAEFGPILSNPDVLGPAESLINPPPSSEGSLCTAVPTPSRNYSSITHLLIKQEDEEDEKLNIKFNILHKSGDQDALDDSRRNEALVHTANNPSSSIIATSASYALKKENPYDEQTLLHVCSLDANAADPHNGWCYNSRTDISSFSTISAQAETLHFPSAESLTTGDPKQAASSYTEVGDDFHLIDFIQFEESCVSGPVSTCNSPGSSSMTDSSNSETSASHNVLTPLSQDEEQTENKKYRYACDVCGKSFSRSNTLTTHKRIHTGDKPFKCEQCGRAFRQPGNLTRHRLTHTTVKPYVCPQCNKAFNRASNLHTHMRTHTNYKPFVCDFCGKGFHQKIDMKIHRYTHTGEKPHKCQKCGRGFKQLTHLTYHMRTHSDVRMYECEYCGKGFNQKGNLQAHIYGHTGQRPYKCDVCGKGFTLASTLNTHKRTHAPKKPFQCQLCDKAFYQKNALKTHYIASHPFANGVSLL